MIDRLWVEKYRPATVADYVFMDAAQKSQVEGWIRDGAIPHLLFSGSPGTGKTTLAKILINQLNINEYDVMQINASNETKIEVMRDKVVNFVSTMPFGAFKVVLLDEADYLSQASQAMLRGLLEEYASTARFILTCNYPNKVIPALHSRCQGFHIRDLDKTELTARIATILLSENVKFELDTLDSYVTAHYPDLRKSINAVQLGSAGGVLQNPASDTATGDYMAQAVELFKRQQYKQARELILNNVTAGEYESIYTWMYDNIELFGEDDEAFNHSVLAIRDGLVNHAFIADPEINLAATLITLTEK